MRDIIKEILDNCPTHGFCTVGAHSLTCPNEDHRKLANSLIEDYSEIHYLETEIRELEEKIKDLEFKLWND